MRSSLATRLSGLAVLGLSLACGTVTVRVPVMRPAEINMAAYRTVAIGQISQHGYGGNSGQLAGMVEQALFDSGRFDVLDRTHMDQVMRELRLSASDLADSSKAAQLGKLVTAGALVYGEADDRYTENTKEDKYQDKDKNNHITYTIRGEALIRATFKITDVSTGKLLITKTYEERRSDQNSATDKRPEGLDKERMFQGARQAIVERFMKAIAPHKEFANANFQKDGDIPQLEGGIGYAERGDWKKAQDTFQAAISAAENNAKIGSKTLAKAYFNLGLAFEYAGDYDKAQKMIEKASDLSNDPDYLHEIDNVRQLQADQKKLAEQAQPPPSN
ncbi:MAG: tetratricopeptide repeat protein [Deltaproteobacteria bacterium]|nr:tetratricopeptide repeat protein [Deltaproteobacteria bacterium]